MVAKAKTTKKTANKIDPAAYDENLPANAPNTNPDIPVDEAVFDAERRLKEAKRQKKLLAKLPSFDSSIVGALAAAVTELENTNETWQKLRKKERGRSLEAIANKARSFQAEVLRKGRYLFRRDDQMLQKIDTISEGDGIADLVSDLGATQEVVKANEKGFDAFKSTKGAAAKLADFEQALTDGSDSVAALSAQAARNLAYWRLDFLSQELYEALVLVIEEAKVDVARVVNLRGYMTRKRAKNRARASAEKKRLAGRG